MLYLPRLLLAFKKLLGNLHTSPNLAVDTHTHSLTYYAQRQGSGVLAVWEFSIPKEFQTLTKLAVDFQVLPLWKFETSELLLKR